MDVFECPLCKATTLIRIISDTILDEGIHTCKHILRLHCYYCDHVFQVTDTVGLAVQTDVERIKSETHSNKN